MMAFARRLPAERARQPSPLRQEPQPTAHSNAMLGVRLQVPSFVTMTWALTGLAGLITTSACGHTVHATTRASAVPESTPEVFAVYPHDASAFTQGLEWHDGALLESTGRYGQSSLRRVQLETGEVLANYALDTIYFGEGLTRVDDRIIQLTWKSGLAFVYDLALEPIAPTSYPYEGEGWGLCYDGTRLVQSDGSATLTFRDPHTFAVQGTVDVTLAGDPISQINELECVDGLVYANVWTTNTIIVIEPTTGTVVHRILAADLLTPEEADSANWLNGIAFMPETGHFLITGKLWPKLFEVRFADLDGDDDDDDNDTSQTHDPDSGSSESQSHGTSDSDTENSTDTGSSDDGMTNDAGSGTTDDDNSGNAGGTSIDDGTTGSAGPGGSDGCRCASSAGAMSYQAGYWWFLTTAWWVLRSRRDVVRDRGRASTYAPVPAR